MSSPYSFKPSSWSSHSLLLRAVPEQGQGRRLLDVGCSDGYLAALFYARGYEVTGVERPGGFSEKFPPEVRLVVHDLEQGLPQLSEKYDYIVCADILEHLRDPAALLRQVRDTLAPGGMLIASLPNSGNFWFRLNVLLGRFPQEDKGLFDRTHVRFYMWRGWQELLRETGFHITSVRPTPVPVGLVTPPAWEDSFAVREAERVFYGLAHLRKTLFAYQFVVCAEPVR